MNFRVLSWWAGGLYLVTHVTSVAAVLLYGGQSYAADASLADRGPVLLGAVCEIVLAVAVVGTAAALFPLIAPRSGAVAAGYLGLRTLEAGVILAGVVAILPVVARPATTAGPQLGAAQVHTLRLLHDWTFLIGPGLIVPFHTVLLAWLLLRTQLVPRAIAVVGLVGAVVIGVVNLSVLAGLCDVIPLAAIPVFLWEISLAVYLLVRGIAPAHRSPPGGATEGIYR